MNYEELSALWKKQDDLYSQWRQKLFASASLLRNDIEECLNLESQAWQNPETNQEIPYITIINFYPERDAIEKRLNGESITENGELIFGIGITFERKANSFPKESIYIPVASRFNNNEIQYSYFDLEKECPAQEWTTDIRAFSERQLRKLGEYLSHDPHNGFENKITMGFIGNS